MFLEYLVSLVDIPSYDLVLTELCLMSLSQLTPLPNDVQCYLTSTPTSVLALNVLGHIRF